MPPTWLHCNVCFERQAKSWHISACGKVVCEDCLQQVRTSHCGDCRGPCTRTIELNSRAPKDVKRLFGDVTEEIKAVSKIIDFQDKHKAKFLLSLRNKNAMLDKKRSDMNKVKKKKLAEIENAKARLAAAKEKIKKKKAKLKSNHNGAENPPSGTREASVDLCSEGFFRIGGAFPPAPDLLFTPQLEQGGHRFYTSTPAPANNMNKTGNLSLDGDFMQLKTPAAWHRQEGGRQRRSEADRSRRSLDMSIVDSRSSTQRQEGRRQRRGEVDRKSLDMSMVDPRSPAIRALDELLEEEPPKKVKDKSTYNYNPLQFFTKYFNNASNH